MIGTQLKGLGRRYLTLTRQGVVMIHSNGTEDAARLLEVPEYFHGMGTGELRRIYLAHFAQRIEQNYSIRHAKLKEEAPASGR